MVLALSTICGLSFGIELWFGDDVDPGDKLAIQLDLFIIRLTIIILE